MGDPYRQAQPGEPLRIPARVYNHLLALLRERPAHTDAGQAAAPRAGTVLVKNTSGADREQFDILGIDAPVFTPGENEDGFRTRWPSPAPRPLKPTTRAGSLSSLSPPRLARWPGRVSRASVP